MPEEFDISLATSQEIDVIQSLWNEYWNSVGLPRDLQGFEEEQKALPGAYGPPRGRLLLARCRGVAAGTAALRPLSEFGCEAKRLYVHPRFRGQGVGAALLNRLIEEARVAGYREMYGDTLTSMRTALQMYSRFGFCEVAPYSANPTPGAIFLKLSL